MFFYIWQVVPQHCCGTPAKDVASWSSSIYLSFQASNDMVVWTQAIQKLYQTYRLVEEEELVRQIQKIETAHGDQKYGEAWRTVNEITGRKRANEGRVTGKNPEEKYLSPVTLMRFV